MSPAVVAPESDPVAPLLFFAGEHATAFASPAGLGSLPTEPVHRIDLGVVAGGVSSLSLAGLLVGSAAEFHFSVLTAPANGRVILDDGELSYLPNPGFVGRDRVTLLICGNDGCATTDLEVVVFPLLNAGKAVLAQAVDQMGDLTVSTPLPALPSPFVPAAGIVGSALLAWWLGLEEAGARLMRPLKRS